MSQGQEGARLCAAAAATAVTELFSRQAQMASSVNLGGPAHSSAPVLKIRGFIIRISE